jgi:hypothetical protein
MCLLRGQIHLRLSSTLQAKESFLEALSLDVRCYDAFQALVGGEMMGVEEGTFSSALSPPCPVLVPFFFQLPFRRVESDLSSRYVCPASFRMGHDPEPLLRRTDRRMCRIHQDDVYDSA